LITQAVNIVVERQKQRKNMKNHAAKKETMTDIVGQKKDIFLVTMTTDIIKKEREKLKKIIDEKTRDLNLYLSVI
jgi:hypothetical protein